MDSSQPNNPKPPLPIEQVINRKYVTIKQLARLLDVTYQTARRYVIPKEGEQPAIRSVWIGGQCRIYEEDLRAFLEQGSQHKTRR